MSRQESKEDMFVSRKDLALAREKIEFLKKLATNLSKASKLTFSVGLTCHMQSANTHEENPHRHFNEVNNEITDPLEFFDKEASVIKVETEKLVSAFYAIRKQSKICNHLQLATILQCLTLELKNTTKALHEGVEIETIMSKLREKY
jgi:hypothetical protein